VQSGNKTPNLGGSSIFFTFECYVSYSTFSKKIGQNTGLEYASSSKPCFPKVDKNNQAQA